MSNASPADGPSNTARPNPKILIIATQNSPIAARISMALGDVGFRVATLTPRRHLVRRVRKIRDQFRYLSGFFQVSAVRVIDKWSPELLVAADDLAVSKLQILHRQTTADGRRHISELIELSQGAAVSFATIRNKSDFLARVQTEGLRCPRTVVVPAGRAFKSVPTELAHPIVVKADQSYGGLCVRIVKSDAAAIRAVVWELQAPASWHTRLRQLFGAILGSKAFVPFMLALRRTVSLQQYIPGRPANRAVICWKGEVLAGINVEAVEVTNWNGPASVVRTIDHPEMAMVSRHMVKSLNLSGFVGFDFIIDSANRAWIIEMNPRVTPICHLALANGTNLAEALHRQMIGLPPSPVLPSDKRDLIALFPNEIVRCPSSRYIESCRHDVPWGEVQFVHDTLKWALRTRILARVRTFIERRSREQTGGGGRSARRAH
jgi:hypothetical protein